MRPRFSVQELIFSLQGFSGGSEPTPKAKEEPKPVKAAGKTIRISNEQKQLLNHQEYSVNKLLRE
jgi:hypothetical protein